jgi:hypothetical protein
MGEQRFCAMGCVDRDLVIYILIATGEGVGGGVLRTGTEYDDKIIIRQNFGPPSLSGSQLFSSYKIFQDPIICKNLYTDGGSLEFRTLVL